jgi:predicted dehydrogenase
VTPRPLRVAVVGVGHLGSIHARIYAELEGAELVCVVDADVERAASVGAEFGCRALADVHELFELHADHDIDAVSVAVPTAFHEAAAVPLLERGVPVLVEKPLAGNLAGADAILAAAERGGATLAVGHVERFQPGLLRVREMGFRPRFIECHRLAPFSFRSTDVGVVHDLMIHDLDLVLDLIDSEVVSIDAAGGAILSDNEDVASVRLVFENGARANVTASRASLKPMRRFRLFAGDAYVSLDFTENHGLVVKKGAEWEAKRSELAAMTPAELAATADWMTSGMLEVVPLELGGEQRPLQAELASFLTAVREGGEPEVTGADGRRALALADRISETIGRQGW